MTAAELLARLEPIARQSPNARVVMYSERDADYFDVNTVAFDSEILCVIVDSERDRCLKCMNVDCSCR